MDKFTGVDLIRAQSHAHLRDRFLTLAFTLVLVVTLCLILLLLMLAVLDTLLVLSIAAAQVDNAEPIERLVTPGHITAAIVGLGSEIVALLTTMGLYLWWRRDSNVEAS